MSALAIPWAVIAIGFTCRALYEIFFGANGPTDYEKVVCDLVAVIVCLAIMAGLLAASAATE